MLNGSRAFALELSKIARRPPSCARLGIAHPRSLAFNDVDCRARAVGAISWPALLKPEQGGSGARMYLLQLRRRNGRASCATAPTSGFPTTCSCCRSTVAVDPASGIVRMEFLGGELLYAMRVISHGAFNLCPSEACNPEDGADVALRGAGDEARAAGRVLPVSPRSPPTRSKPAGRIMAAGGLDVGGIEYLEAADGRLVFYDINANSNLRAPIGQAFGFDPFERVVDYLTTQMARVS